MLKCGQFIAKNLILWFTLLFVCFEKLNFSDFWGPLNLQGPSKKTRLLDSWPLGMHQKTKPWINLFKNIVLCLFYKVLNTNVFPLKIQDKRRYCLNFFCSFEHTFMLKLDQDCAFMGTYVLWIFKVERFFLLPIRKCS